jgi:dipeptidyl aminopeptidase/acylaminoacyl peptidase
MTPLDSAKTKSATQTAFAFDPTRLVGLKRVSDVVPSPCGTWAAVAVDRLNSEGGKYACDLWRISLTDDAAPTQLTRGDWRDTSPCFRHDGALGFISNRVTGEKAADSRDENPLSQVWVLPAAGGEPMRITDEPFGVNAFKFATDADRMVAVAGVITGVADDAQRETAKKLKTSGESARHYTRMPVRYWDHWLPGTKNHPTPHFLRFDANGGNRVDLTPQAMRDHEAGDGAAFDISADGNRAAIQLARPGPDRIDDTALLVFDFVHDKQKVLGDMAATNLDHPLFSADGERIACTRMRRSPKCIGKVRMVVFDIASGKDSVIADQWDRWPVPAAWSEDGKTIIATADNRAAAGVFAIDIASGKVTPIVNEKAGGNHVQVHAVTGGTRVTGIRSTLLEAPEVFATDIGNTEGNMPKILARLSGMDAGFGDGIAQVENLEAVSTDGVPVQYFFIRPRNAKGRLPTLMWIHGGPIGAWNDLWFFRWNALAAVARGYAVVMANPRGSTGFGQDFAEGIWGNVWGAQCYEDLMAVTDAVATRPDVDGARMAAMGGSFGGYMTNWIGASTDRFRCLVTHASIFSMSGFYGDTDMPAWWLLEIGPDPYRDQVAYDRYSPSLKMDNWKSPTLVIHGEKDYRVGITQGLTLFECLQQRGIDSELLVFPDENHWILKPANSVAWYETVFDFLGRHLS